MKSFDVTCVTVADAQTFSWWLAQQGVDSSSADDVVTVPWGGGTGFMMSVYEFAVAFGFAHDATASDEMCELLP